MIIIRYIITTHIHSLTHTHIHTHHIPFITHNDEVIVTLSFFMAKKQYIHLTHTHTHTYTHAYTHTHT